MIGVIADDLTGAAEIGAVGLRHGLRAEIVVKGQPGGAADLVCVDTDSRSCEAGEAGRRAAAAAKLLKQVGAHWIYKKVDSVLRGQVTAEVESVMKQLRLNRALLVPANPSLGRTIRAGRYLVRGRPIHKTEFARDPEHPRKSSQVLELLKPPETVPIHLTHKCNALPAAGIIVGEAATSQDVRQWAFFRDSRTLMAGGSEFFGALLAANRPAPPSPVADSLPGNGAGRELFICGTSSPSARKFVAAVRRRKTPVFSLPLELAWGAAFIPAAAEAISQRVVTALKTHPRVVLHVGLPPVREASVARQLSGCLVQIAQLALQRAKVGHVYAAGGATAMELVRRMGWTRLAVLQELAPGVATLAVEDGPSLLLTIKPGSYAWPAKWT